MQRRSKFEILEKDHGTDCFDKENTSRLSALLGLKRDFFDHLEVILPEFYDHWTLEYWITTLLNNNCETVSSTLKNSLSKELLDAIGFDTQSEVVKTVMTRSFEASLQHHIESCEWAEIFIKDELKYNPLLGPLSVNFPFQSNLTNSWFQLPNIADEGRESEVDRCHVNIMNLVTKKSHASRNIHAVLSDTVPQNEQNILLYHGTDHLSAADILDRGIDLCAGRQKRDFSCGSGFYLTSSLDHALDWAKSTTAKPTILVFEDNRGDLDDAKKLNLYENEDRWLEIVSSFRSGQRTAKTRKSLSSYDVIEGPMAVVTRSETSDELVFEPKPSSYQMCVISADFAEAFQRTLHSVVFFDVS